jgi:hypothetical protein
MKLLSSTDLAIAMAIRTDSLRVVEREGRFGAFWSIEDAFGVIEVALSAEEAGLRVGAIEARAA